MTPIVVILRGLPGSGKSSVASLLRAHYYISMDLFWTKDGEPYKFDYNRLEEAIQWTHLQFIQALCGPIDPTAQQPKLIVVDNVSYALEHFRFFEEEAKKVGARVHVVHVERPLKELFSSHNVLKDKIIEMADKWERIR